MRDALRMAVGTLTVLPVRPPDRLDRRVAGGAMLAAPVPGALLGLAAGAVAAAGALVQAPALLTGTAVVAVLAVGSRGLHLDGLADTADGLGASYDPQRALQVMRSGDVGPFGVVTLVLVLLAQVGALATLLTLPAPGAAGSGWWRNALVVTGAVVASRTVLPLVCAAGWRAARPDGLGAAVVGTVPRWAAGVAVAAVLGAVTAAGALAGASPVWSLPVAALAGWTAALLLVARVVRRLGGVTGDVLGAAVECAFVVTLVTAVLAA